jgi:hypothetical protein
MPSKIRKSKSAYKSKSKSKSHKGGAKRLSKQFSKKNKNVLKRRKSKKYIKRGGVMTGQLEFKRERGMFGRFGKLLNCEDTFNKYHKKVMNDQAKQNGTVSNANMHSLTYSVSEEGGKCKVVQSRDTQN